MICTHCGAKNEEGSRFCTECGTRLEAPASGLQERCSKHV